MVQFTLGCILIVLSLFFGVKEIMSNEDIITNRTSQLNSEESRVLNSNKLKDKFEGKKSEAMLYSADLKNNLLNQLNIDESKYVFNLDKTEKKNQVIVSYKYRLNGYDSYTNVVSLFRDIEKIKGLFVDNICFNCDIITKKKKHKKEHISFKIEGSVYVYNDK